MKNDRVPEGFVLIPAGPYEMGDALGEGASDECPVHEVQVGAFCMGKTQVTKAQWDETFVWAMDHGYEFENRGEGNAPDHPVYYVSWHDVVKWCNAHGEKERLAPCYRVAGNVLRTGKSNDVVCDWGVCGYRLPTEAEWEKAARGGLKGKRFPWGDTISHREANFENGGDESYAKGTTGYHPDFDDGFLPYTSPVGSFAPNGYGLYDMTGNVWEWCWDWYAGSYYSNLPAPDPQGPATGSNRVLRGGSWSFNAWSARVSNRYGFRPDYWHLFSGFRLARGCL